jgi:hypothetical protein
MPKYLVTGPFNNGNAAPSPYAVQSKREALAYVRTDTAYWSKFSDTVNNVYFLHLATDQVDGTDYVDGYPLQTYTVTTRGIRVNNDV